MQNCKKCNGKIEDGNQLACPNCGSIMCSNCAESSFRICPYCYHDLEFIG